MICQVWRSQRKSDTYLYTRLDEGLARVPEELAQRLGELVPVLKLNLDSRQRLARVEVPLLLAALEERGYYLQLPATHQDEMAQQMRARNDKLPRY